MIPWTKGEPDKIVPGQLLHYESGLVELVGSQRYVVTGPIQAYYSAVPVYWLDWVSGLANKEELGK